MSDLSQGLNQRNDDPKGIGQIRDALDAGNLLEAHRQADICGVPQELRMGLLGLCPDRAE